MSLNHKLADFIPIQNIILDAEAAACPQFPDPVGMGVEIEIENATGVRLTEESSAYWGIKDDPSLRNNGKEFVFLAPKSGRNFMHAIELFNDMVEAANIKPVLTTRCSMHIHINVSDMTANEAINLFMLFLLFEPALYTVGNKDRYHNTFCVGFTHQPNLLYSVGEVLYSDNIHSFLKMVNGWFKYTGFNFAPISQQGSVEIRTHQGTLNADDIILWARLLNCITVYSKNKTTNEIMSLADIGMLQAIKQVFPESLQEYVFCPALDTYWEHSTRNVRHIQLMRDILINNKNFRLVEEGEEIDNIMEVL